MPLEFKKAERKQAKLRLAICSPSGGGKTFSALKIAKGLGGKIAMIDTEHGSGSLYADNPGMPPYDVLELDAPYTPKRYLDAIHLAEKAGYSTIILDSISHAWAGEGGILEMHDKARAASKSGNSFVAWREVTPEHNKFVEALLTSPCHIIATMRTKQEYAQVQSEGSKTEIKKLGLQPVQREGMDYEFTLVFDLTIEHIATASKDRTSLFDGKHFIPDESTGDLLLKWLSSAKSTVRAGAPPVAGASPGAEPPSHSPPGSKPAGTPEQPGQPTTGTSDLSSATKTENMPTPSTPAEAAPAATVTINELGPMPKFANWGEFWQYLWTTYKVSKENFCQVTKKYQSDYANMEECWQAFCAWWKGQK